MHVIDHLTEEHRKAEKLLARLAESDEGATRNRLIDELDEALRVHMAVEEMFVYPITAEVMDTEEVQEANAEHMLAREGLQRLRQFADEPGFGAVVDMLTAGIGHHVREEESEIFPALRKRAGDRLDAMDPETLEREARQAGLDRGRAAASDGLTKDELYAMAQEADIPGRSQMTKKELAAALGRS